MTTILAAAWLVTRVSIQRVAVSLMRVRPTTITVVRGTAASGLGSLKAKDAAKAAGWPEPKTVGSSAASEAFFPFPDGLQTLTDAGVKAVVHPGGSMRDDVVTEAGSAFVAGNDNVGVDPALAAQVPGGDWALMAAKGAFISSSSTAADKPR